MKRLTITILTALLFLAVLPVSAAPSADDIDTQTPYWFSDIADSVHRVDIAVMAENHVTQGCNPPVNSLYCPKDNVTRGQMAKFIRRASGLPLRTGLPPAFPDIASSVFVDEINSVQNIVTGIGVTNYFRPDWDVSRINVIRWGWNAGWCGHKLNNIEVFDDVTLDDPVFAADVPYVWACYNTGFVKGYSGSNLLGPNDSLTREQMASFVVRGANLK